MDMTTIYQKVTETVTWEDQIQLKWQTYTHQTGPGGVVGYNASLTH